MKQIPGELIRRADQLPINLVERALRSLDRKIRGSKE